MTYNEIIEHYRTSRGLTQEEIAKIQQEPYILISQTRKGNKQMPTARFIHLANIFNYSLDEFLKKKEETHE